MGFAVLIGLFVGQYLDSRLGTEPWFLLLFLLFGAAAGFLSLYRLLRSAVSDAKEQDSGKEEGES
jgi:ATP synthase protein I